MTAKSINQLRRKSQ